MNDDNVNLVNLLPPPLGVSMSLPQLMHGIENGTIDRATGAPIAPPPPSAVVDTDIAKWQSEKAAMHDEMRELLLAKSQRTTDYRKAQRLRAAADQLKEQP